MFPNAHFRELQITTSARDLSAPFTMVITNGLHTRNAGKEDMPETELFYLVLRNGSEQPPPWRTVWMFLKELRTQLLHDLPAHPWAVGQGKS